MGSELVAITVVLGILAYLPVGMVVAFLFGKTSLRDDAPIIGLGWPILIPILLVLLPFVWAAERARGPSLPTGRVH